MKRLTMTVAAIALTTGAAVAQTATDEETQILPQDGVAAESEQMMDETGDALAETGDAVENSMEETGDALETAAEETGDALENTAEATGNAVENTVADAKALFANDEDGLIRTRDITGGTVYAIDADGELTDWDESMTYDAVAEGWDNVGEIEDIVLNADGSFEGIVAEVGGFLDIGDKHVHLTMEDAKLVPLDDGSYSVVTNFTKDQLMEMQNVDESFMN